MGMLPKTREVPEYDLLSLAFRQNPYPTLHRMREEDPIHYSPQLKAWLVTRYDDVLAGLQHPAISADRISPRMLQFPEQARPEFEPLTRILSKWALMMDRPDHTRFRTLINKAMTRPIIMSFRPLIQRIVNQMLDAAQAQGGLDVMTELALPLPLYVVSELIGAPQETFEQLKRCAFDIVSFFGTPPHTYLPTASVAMRSVEDTVELLREAVRARQRSPRGDLISNLLAAREYGETFDEEEIIATCLMMIFAGFETTQNLLGNGILLLLQHPEQYELLRRDGALMRNAVDEMLRYESPVQRLSRMASADLMLRGRTIRQGELLFFMASAANRDPAVFAEPDRFKVNRSSSSQHIAFGHWIHTCPGSTLAHLEGSIVFGELCRRGLRMKLHRDQPPQWLENLSIRSLKSLLVNFI
jgi:hypothetical protein